MERHIFFKKEVLPYAPLTHCLNFTPSSEELISIIESFHLSNSITQLSEFAVWMFLALGMYQVSWLGNLYSVYKILEG